MRVLVDAQLPPALARWLTERGDEAVHVADVGLSDARDSAIWKYAESDDRVIFSDDRVIFSKDEDFARRRSDAVAGPVVVWIRFGNLSRQESLERLEPLMPQIRHAFQQGEALIEVRDE